MLVRYRAALRPEMPVLGLIRGANLQYFGIFSYHLQALSLTLNENTH